MPRRVILAFITMLCVGAALLLYSYANRDIRSAVEDAPPLVNNDDPDTSKQQNQSENIAVEGPIEVEIGTTEQISFERRDPKTGKLLREFGFERRLGGGDGLLERFSKPRFKIYGKDGLLMEMTAETAAVDIDSTIGEPQSGYLEGNVLISMYRSIQTEGQTTEEHMTELVANLERVDFQREFSRLTSSGKVKVRSTSFALSGADLTMQYDQVNERLQELRLVKLDELLIAKSAIDTAAKNDTDETPGKADGQEDNTEIQTNLPKIETYRLMLAEKVSIDDCKQQQLNADTVEILTSIDPKDAKPTANDTKRSIGQDDKKNADKNGPVNGNSDAGFIGSDNYDPETTIVVKCKGDLRISTVEQTQPDARPGQMIFLAKGEPVTIVRDGKTAVMADEILYDSSKKAIQFSAVDKKDDRPVKLYLAEEQYVTAKEHISVNQATGEALLSGPGYIRYITEDSAKPATIEYNELMQIKFATNDTGRGNYGSAEILWDSIEWLDFSGGLTAAGTQGQVHAQQGRLVFYPKENKKTEADPQIKTIELTGDVEMLGADGRFTAERLIGQFEPSQGQKDSSAQLKRLIAEGMVKAEDQEYIIEADERLELEFAKDAQKEIADTETGRADSMGFEQLLNRSELVAARADGPNGTMRLTDKQQQYTVIGDMAAGETINNIWVVTGEPAKIVGASEASQFKGLTGPVIRADLGKKMFEINGAGSMQAVTQQQGQTQNMPIDIAWQDRAVYNMTKNEVVIYDVRAEIGRQEQNDYWNSSIVCPSMTVKLAKDTEQTAKDDIDAAGRRLERLVGHGPNVRLKSDRFAAGTDGKPVQSIQMLAQRIELEPKTSRRQRIWGQGPGWLEMIDYRKPTPGDTGEAKQDGLAKMATDSANSYSLIRFGREMRLDDETNELVFDGGVSVDQLPLPQSQEAELSAANIMTAEGRRRLDCDRLYFGFFANNGDQNEFAGPVAAADKIKYVRAEGDVFFETILDGKNHTASAEKFLYNLPDDSITMTGSINLPVLLDQMRFSRVKINLTGGDIETEPLGPSSIVGAF